jgi:hypothetical protein
MLPRMPCTPESVQEACNTHRDWQLDGLLFYLNEVERSRRVLPAAPCDAAGLQRHFIFSQPFQGYYDAGESPLALWLKATDVASVLRVPIDLPAPRPHLLPIGMETEVIGMETEVSVAALACSSSQGHGSPFTTALDRRRRRQSPAAAPRDLCCITAKRGLTLPCRIKGRHVSFECKPNV